MVAVPLADDEVPDFVLLFPHAATSSTAAVTVAPRIRVLRFMILLEIDYYFTVQIETMRICQRKVGMRTLAGWLDGIRQAIPPLV